MQFRKTAAVAALAATVSAQRPTNMSICDYYTTALLKDNTATNQYTLLTLVVNTAVIGNYTKPNVGIKVNGILNPGTYNGVAVNLLPYFDGGLASTSNFTNQNQAIAVNFLDGGGAAPLLKNMPANDNSSAQYILLTHLYTYFGALLGCSTYGTPGFPAYSGRGSQYNVHRFMDLDVNEVSYFIEQVGLSAASFGVATADVTAVGNALAGIFDVRCAPPTTVIPAQGAQLQSICIADDCPLAPNSTCSAYQPAMEPYVANATLAMGEGRNMTGSSSMIMSSSYSAQPTMSSAMTSGGVASSIASSIGSAAASGMSSVPAVMSSGAAAASSAASSAASGTGAASMKGSATGSAAVAPYTGAASNVKAQVGAVLGGVAMLAMAL